jgi:hypothetical protein
MANTYIARGVTLTEATLAGPGRVLVTNGRGTFTVDGNRHTLRLDAGEFRRPLREKEPVNAVGIATVSPPRMGAFPIHETMSVVHPTLPVSAEGPIFLAVKGVHEHQAAGTQ